MRYFDVCDVRLEIFLVIQTLLDIPCLLLRP